MSLDNSNWTIIHKTYFCSLNFHFKPDAGFPFSSMQKKGRTLQWIPKVSNTKGCMTLGHSNWTIRSSQDLFLQLKFPLYKQSICSISLFQHAEKGTPYRRTQKWITPRSVWPWAIQIEPFGFQKTYFCNLKFYIINKSCVAFPFLFFCNLHAETVSLGRHSPGCGRKEGQRRDRRKTCRRRSTYVDFK